MKKRWLYVIPVLCTLMFLLLGISDPSSIRERIETLTLDYRFHIRNLITSPPVSKDILIVSVDEQSIKQFGRWPWSRKLQAKLIERILQERPRVLAIDIFYSEPEKDKDADAALLEAIKKGSGKVVLASTFEVEKGKIVDKASEAPIGSAFLKVRDFNQLKPPNAYDVLLLPLFAESAPIGHVYIQPDRDGKLRWECLYLKYGDELYPSFALQTSAVAMGKSIEDMTILGNSGVSLDKIIIPTDSHGRLLINYRGKERSYKYISASDVLSDNIKGGILTDKIVLIGTSAIATYDVKVTPFSANMPGVEKNATVVDNILTQDFLKTVPKSINLFAIMAIGIILGFVLPRMRALKGTLFSVGFILIYGLTAQALFSYGLLWLHFVYPVTNGVFIAIAVTTAKYFTEEKKARQLKRIFSSYVSPKIVEEIINNPEKAHLCGERRIVTVLFADIVEFTALSESLQPEEVVSIMNEYFEEMTEVIFRWDGTLDKFVGDEIMAFWGAPVAQSNHAELAIKCALHMSRTLDKLHEKWKREGKPILECGIGLNTGEVIVGNIGAEGKKMDYTIIGDHVNIGARVEKLTREFGARILISEHTLHYIKDQIALNKIGHVILTDLATVKVKGKEKKLRVYRFENSEDDLT